MARHFKRLPKLRQVAATPQGGRKPKTLAPIPYTNVKSDLNPAIRRSRLKPAATIEMRRTVRVKTEARRERVIIRGKTNLATSFCAECEQAARFVTPETAAWIIHSNTREVYRRIESGGLHYVEVDGVALLVCVNSLEVETDKALMLKQEPGTTKSQLKRR